MISNVIDLNSGIGGTKDASTEAKIASSQQEEESGSPTSFSMYATSGITERTSDQSSPGKFIQTSEYAASLNRSDVETLNLSLHQDNILHPAASPLVTPATLQGGINSASDARKTSSYDAAQLSQLQTLTGKANEISLSLNQTQTSPLPLSEPQGGKHQSYSPFSASLSAGNNTNLHLPLSLTEYRLSDANEANVQVLAGAHRAQAPVSQWGPVPVTSTAPLAHQAQEMLSPLREQIRFQVDQQIKQAELRLDPPELGKVELNIRLDGDRLHIQMHAANASVRDSLLIGLERLRAELAMDHGGQIDVDINQGKQEQKEPSSEAPSITLARVDESDTHSTKHNSQQSNQIDLLA